VRIFTLLHRGAAAVGGVEHLGSETLLHRVFRTGARSNDQPADGESLTALGANFDRNLVGGAADPAGANLNRRSDVAQRFVKQLGRRTLRFRRNGFQRAVDNLLGGGFFPLVHHLVHEAGDDLIAILGVGKDLAFFCAVTTGHVELCSAYFGRLTP
jgi:hypothetical protein